jgi:hypothetical protein
MNVKETIGWVATAACAASYVCTNQQSLRRLQALAASLWIVYGVLVGALPVIVANVVVATMAVIYPWARDAWANRTARREAAAQPADHQSVEAAVNSHLTIEPLSLAFASPPLRPRPVTLDA